MAIEEMEHNDSGPVFDQTPTPHVSIITYILYNAFYAIKLIILMFKQLYPVTQIAKTVFISLFHVCNMNI
jgi:hypothetical protein